MNQRIEEKLELQKSEYIPFVKWLFKRNAKFLYPERLICSRYFDTHNLRMLKDTLEGILPRKKIRIRTYGCDEFEESNSYSLEIKLSRENDRFKKIEKDINRLFYEKNGIYDSNYGISFPVIDISYKREYFILDGIRITIDKEIKYKSKDLNSKIFYEEFFVAEIKASAETNKDFLINSFDFPRKRFSKYERGMNSFYNFY